MVSMLQMQKKPFSWDLTVVLEVFTSFLVVGFICL